MQQQQLVTANERLSREYRRAYDLHQQAQGELAWPTPNVTSLNRYFLQQYADLRHEQPGKHQAVVPRSTLLTMALDVQPGASLQLVQSFVDAFETCLSYDIDFDDIRDFHARGSFFSDWAASLIDGCKRNVFVQQIPRTLRAAEKSPSHDLLTVLLEELTHPERDYFDWLCQQVSIRRVNTDGTLVQAVDARTVQDRPAPAAIKVSQSLSAQNFGEELHAASNWAADLLRDQPSTRIGIVVPSLASHHAKICEEMGLALSEESGSDDPRFDISGGETLAQQAVWQAARTFLEFAMELAIDTQPVVEELIASPFFSQLDLTRLREWPRSLPARPSQQQLARVLNAEWFNALRLLDLAGQTTAEEWWLRFKQVLDVAGWPNSGQLGSRQYQAFTAIEGTLARVASARTLTAKAALEYIHLVLSAETFAPERKPANILVLGLLEANGLSFDHLWVCGMDDENFPRRNSALPLIPRRITKSAGVPRADQDDELEFATRLLQRWCGQAAHVVASYTRTVDDAERRLTRLIEAENREIAINRAPRKEDAVVLENFSDDYGTSLLDGGPARGGVRLLEDQAACPMRAYAVHRLGITRKETPNLLPDPLIRGIILHDALHALFTAAKNKAEILRINQAAIELAVQQAIQRITYPLPPAFEVYEKERVAELLYGWLEVEALRDEFEIYALESSYTLTLSNLSLTVRADRIDKLQSGNLIVIDYKTGQIGTSGLLDPPLQRPQLPVYSLVETQVAGALYAAIRKDDVRLLGVCAPEDDPGGARLLPMPRPWSEQIAIWREELTRLAHDYENGYAAVEPVSGACDYCHLSSFCRVDDSRQ